jgi:hypothetical protein
MGEQHRIDVCGIERKGLTVALVGIASTLDEPAIDEQCASTDPENMAGARDFTCRAEEFDLHASSPETSNWV